MVNVHLARTALLVAVLLGGKAVGLLHLREVVLIHIFEAQALQLVVAVRHNLGRQLIGMLIVLHLRKGWRVESWAVRAAASIEVPFP